MKLFFKLAAIILITNIAKADLLKPNITLKPIEVLKIQLNSLKNNNLPYKDAGIEQTWEFAHPDNKKATGPLSKFKKIMYSNNYKILLDHTGHQIEVVMETESKHVFLVKIFTTNKINFFYEWQVSKVNYKDELEGCWLTTAVSHPKSKDEISITIFNQI